MHKLLKYLIVIFLFLAILGASWGLIFTHLYGPEMKERVLREINKNVLTTVEINGPVELSVFKHFPKVSLAINDIYVAGSLPENDTALLKADKLYLMLDLLDVIRQNWIIKTVAIENGTLNLLRDANGNINYKLQDQKVDSSNTSSFLLDIDQALLNEIDFSYHDILGDVYIDLHLNKGKVKGNFSAAELSLLASVNIFSKSIKIKDIDYAHHKQLDIDGSLKVDTKDESYHLDISKLVSEKNHFKVNGNIKAQDQGPFFNLKITGQDISIKDFPKLLPANVNNYIRDFEGAGKLQFNANIKGELSKTKNPEITASATVTDGRMKYNKLSNPINQLSFNVTFSNGNKQSLQTSTLLINDFKGKIEDKNISAQLSLANFKDPRVNLSIHGTVDLSLFNPFLSSSKIKSLEGNVIANNFTFKGKIKDLIAGSLGPKAEFQGVIQMDHAKITLDSFSVQILSGKMTANNSTASFEKINVELPGTKFSFSGQVQNLTRLISDNSKGWTPPLKTDLTVRADHIDLRRLLYIFQTEDHSSSPSDKGTGFNLKGKVNVQSNFIQYDKFKAYDVSGICVLNPNKIELKDFSLNTMDGIIDISSLINIQGDKINSKTHLLSQNVDISKLFYQMNNFGQDALTDKNLKGKLSTKLDITASFKDKQLDYNNLYALADITIKDGQLISYKPLEKLSRFVDIEELRNVRFSTLKNQIHIDKRTIYIPEMLIQSNAMNLYITGLHTMDNLIDYRIKLNIFDVLAKKIKKRKFNTDEYEVISADNFNFFLTMSGDLDNPTIKYDKQGLKQQFKKETEKDQEQEYNTKKELQDWEVGDDLEYIDWE